MAIWPFNRKKQDSDLPEEIQNYYQEEQRQRRGVAGLLAVATLVVTVLLALGLYFGGRWVWRTAFDNEDIDTTSQTEPAETGTPAEQAPAGESATPPSTSDNQQPSQLPSGETETTATQTPTSTPTTGDDLPNTGPGDTMALFIGTVIISAIAHNLLTRRPRTSPKFIK